MIKLNSIKRVSDCELDLSFSDGSHGIWSAATLLAAETVLTKPLANPDYFARAFVEAGALAWPNGLELSGWSLQTELRDAGLLKRSQAA